MTQALGSEIRKARNATGKTLRATAQELSISSGLLSLIEQDKHVPPKKLIVAIAKHLGASPDDWCALAGKLAPRVEASLAKIARERPHYFRTLLNEIERS